MHPAGLTQVKARLQRLREAAETVLSDRSVEERHSAWLDFLQTLGTIYSKLEQAAKTAPESKKWFDGKKSERKSDDLLIYLQHSRNAEEHTINDASGAADISVSLTYNTNDLPAEIRINRNINGKPSVITVGGKDVAIHRNEVMLHAAKDRGVIYRPPKEHLGQAIESNTAREVVKYALTYAEVMVSEAEALKSAT